VRDENVAEIAFEVADVHQRFAYSGGRLSFASCSPVRTEISGLLWTFVDWEGGLRST
jgi:hypothetical protein